MAVLDPAPGVDDHSLAGVCHPVVCAGIDPSAFDTGEGFWHEFCGGADGLVLLVCGPTETLRLLARKLSRNAVAVESSVALAQSANDAASAAS